MTADDHVVTSLAGEHQLLLAEVRARTDAVLRQIAAGTWPAAELRALVDYLQIEVLRQVADEEWLLYRNAREAAGELDRLRHDHLELRLTVDRLTQAATDPTALAPAALAATVDDLLQRAATHLADEEAVLAAAGDAAGAAPSTASLGSQPHEWYELTEGPVIDLDRLPGAQGADAAVDRLLRLRVGERVELRSSLDPSPLWRRVWQVDPAGFGVTQLHRGEPQWRVEIVRRPPEGPLTPVAG
jgi:uncharacterized protein (DUF2249 family)